MQTAYWFEQRRTINKDIEILKRKFFFIVMFLVYCYKTEIILYQLYHFSAIYWLLCGYFSYSSNSWRMVHITTDAINVVCQSGSKKHKKNPVSYYVPVLLNTILDYTCDVYK